MLPSSVHVTWWRETLVWNTKWTQTLIRSSFQQNWAYLGDIGEGSSACARCHGRLGLSGDQNHIGTGMWWEELKPIWATNRSYQRDGKLYYEQKFWGIQAKHGFVLSQIWKAQQILSPNNFYRTQVSLGSDLWVQFSKTDTCFWNLTCRWRYKLNTNWKCKQGNVAMQVTQSNFWTNASDVIWWANFESICNKSENAHSNNIQIWF